jgi:hypothetical protein
MRAACQPLQSRLLAVRNLLGGQQRQEIPIGPPLPFRPIDQPAPDPAGIRQM